MENWLLDRKDFLPYFMSTGGTKSESCNANSKKKKPTCGHEG